MIEKLILKGLKNDGLISEHEYQQAIELLDKKENNKRKTA